MHYVMSDIHGCFSKFMKLLEKINLKDDDTLFVLGDVVDRGHENVKLIAELASRKNIRVLRGNHDHLAALMLRAYEMPPDPEETYSRRIELAQSAKGLFEAWFEDGGDTTWEEFVQLDLQAKKIVLRFLERLPLFTEISVNGQTYFLSHTVPEADKMRDENRRSLEDYLFGDPEYDKEYYEDKILVTGHTPTGLIDPSFAGRIWKMNHHIAVDCGAVFGNPLGCICLDTGEEFYAA